MIRLKRLDLPQDTVTRMDGHTGEIRDSGEPADKARYLWKHTTVRRHVHPALFATLGDMAPGHERCMYCGDNQGSDIDHFEPLSAAPLRTFEWENHLLACTVCNSHHKRHVFPRDEAGNPLLIDPTIQDPLDHLHLVLGTGLYRGLTPQGESSIDVFGLNARGALVKGRHDAYRTAVLFLEQWRVAADKGQTDKARLTVRIAWDRPLADVLASMFHQAAYPAAEMLFSGEDEVLDLLRDPALRTGFLG
ncbi:HNH endonuclease [Streptomyces sp. NBC_01102]|uniref:HNH endonuclease n=1 Tax=unclassified Streptomyces TaxID=2593676 RepID=UPI0038637C5B|nr:HNH endonuclease [Streptomyces sp. NBC_01102]